MRICGGIIGRNDCKTCSFQMRLSVTASYKYYGHHFNLKTGYILRSIGDELMTDKEEQSESNQDKGFGTVRGRLLQKAEFSVANKENKNKTNTNSDK